MNPKLDDKGEFKTSSRIESCCIDIIELYHAHEISLVLSDKWNLFWNYKNGIETGKINSDRGLPPETPGTAEAQLYY